MQSHNRVRRIPLTNEIFPASLYDIAYGPDGTAVAVVADDRLQVVSLRTGAVATIDSGGPRQVRFNPAGTLLAATWGTGELRVYSVASRERLYALGVGGPSQPPRVLAFSPDGRVVAALDVHGRSRFFAPATGVLLEARPAGRLPAALWFTPDGRAIVAAGYAGTWSRRIESTDAR